MLDKTPVLPSPVTEKAPGRPGRRPRVRSWETPLPSIPVGRPRPTPPQVRAGCILVTVPARPTLPPLKTSPAGSPRPRPTRRTGGSQFRPARAGRGASRAGCRPLSSLASHRTTLVTYHSTQQLPPAQTATPAAWPARLSTPSAAWRRCHSS